jgi:hypothetical protein
MQHESKPPTGRRFKLNTIEDAARLLLEPDVDEVRAWESIRRAIQSAAYCVQAGMVSLDHVYIDDGKDDQTVTFKYISK